MKFWAALLFSTLLLACEPVPTVNTGKRYASGSERVLDAIVYDGTNGAWLSQANSIMSFAMNTQPSIGFQGPKVSRTEKDTLLHFIRFDILVDGRSSLNDIKIKQYSEAGVLHQELTHETLDIALRLFFMESDVVAIDLIIQNTGKGEPQVDFVWPVSTESVEAIINYPPDKKTLKHNDFTPQRINFLAYERRQLTWVIQSHTDLIFEASEPHRPLVDVDAYERDCARWRLRSSVFRNDAYPVLAAQCMQLLYAGWCDAHQQITIAVDSGITDWEKMPEYEAVAPAKLEDLAADSRSTQQMLLKDSVLVKDVLLSLITH